MLCAFLRSIAMAIVITLVLALAAGQGGSSSSRHSHAVSGVKRAPDLGMFADGLYRNQFFGFSYRVPLGWVDRTEDMRRDGTGGDARTSSSVVLLSVFERPPEATGDTVNSSVLILAESVSTYPGLKDASQYFGPLTEVTTAKGFKVVHEPYDVEVRGRSLVRADFSKQLGKLTMYQATLATIDKSHIVSFTFVAGSEDETEELIANLSFSGKSRPVQR